MTHLHSNSRSCLLRSWSIRSLSPSDSSSRNSMGLLPNRRPSIDQAIGLGLLYALVEHRKRGGKVNENMPFCQTVACQLIARECMGYESKLKHGTLGDLTLRFTWIPLHLSTRLAAHRQIHDPSCRRISNATSPVYIVGGPISRNMYLFCAYCSGSIAHSLSGNTHDSLQG
jgi:hypothetical protein